MSKALTVQELPFTGERLVTGATDQIQMIYEHLHRYLWAASHVTGKVVLDIACGEGYGTSLLAQRAAHVTGVDIAPDAVRHAARKYRRPNIRFARGDCARIPMANASVDVVVSFETIEHIDAPAAFLVEVKRVLREGGMLLISSPDKAEYTERLGQQNPFHRQEMYHGDFAALMRSHFAHVTLGRQRLVGGSYLAADGHEPGHIYGTFRGDFAGGTFSEGVHEGLYSIAACSDAPLPPLQFGLFENRHESDRMWDIFATAPKARAATEALAERLRGIEAELERKAGQLAEAEARCAGLAADAGGLRQQAADLRVEAGRQADELRAEASRQSEERARLGGMLAESQRVRHSLAREVEERGKWGQALERELADTRTRALGLEEARAALERELADTRTRVLGLEEGRATLAREVEERGKWGQALTRELEEAKGQIAALERARAGLESQIGEALARAEGIGREKDALQAQARTREQTLERMGRTAEEGRRGLETQLAEAQALVTRLMGDLESKTRWAIDLHEMVPREREAHAAAQRALEQEIERERAQRALLEDKIRRMQKSFSWRSTAALRATRRALLDK